MKRKSMDEDDIEDSISKKVKVERDHTKVINCVITKDKLGITHINYENYLDAIEIIQSEYKLKERTTISYRY